VSISTTFAGFGAVQIVEFVHGDYRNGMLIVCVFSFICSTISFIFVHIHNQRAPPWVLPPIPHARACQTARDPVTNGPLKAGILRRKRVQDLYDYMVSWRHQRLRAKSEQQQDPDVVLPPFSPPKPTVSVALKNLFSVEISDLRKDSYKQSLQACFVKASQMVDPETGKFRPYTDVKAGLLKTKLAGVASVDGDGTDLNPTQAQIRPGIQGRYARREDGAEGHRATCG
jgi:hypothetical protein